MNQYFLKFLLLFFLFSSCSNNDSTEMSELNSDNISVTKSEINLSLLSSETNFLLNNRTYSLGNTDENSKVDFIKRMTKIEKKNKKTC